jgi:nucleoside-diphosphate-sugar epimerase
VVKAIRSQDAASTPRTVALDLADPASIERAVNEAEADIVFHSAGIATVTGSRPLEFYKINAVGTEWLLDAITRRSVNSRFILLSTAGVYGNQKNSELNEDMLPLPVHHYGFSKFVAERMVHMQMHSTRSTIVRPFNVIGGGQRGEFLVPKIANHFKRGAPTIRLGNMEVRRDYADLDFVCDSLVRIMEAEATVGEVVNLCTGRPTSIGDIVQSLVELTGHEIEVEQDPDLMRKDEIWELVGSTRKLRRLVPNLTEPLSLKDAIFKEFVNIGSQDQGDGRNRQSAQPNQESLVPPAGRK